MTTSERLIEAAKNLRYRKKRKYSIYVITCYKLIERLSVHINVVQINFSFEFMEIYRHRLPSEITSQLDELKKHCGESVRFNYRLLRVGTLMHAKGYAIVHNRNGILGDGLKCIGSINATFQGLGLQEQGDQNNQIKPLLKNGWVTLRERPAGRSDLSIPLFD